MCDPCKTWVLTCAWYFVWIVFFKTCVCVFCMCFWLSLEQDDLMIAKLQETMGHLSLQIRNLEDAFYIRQKEMKDSYLSETSWWKLRCDEKNKLIEVLGRRVAQLCVTDIHGFYLDGILRDIEKVRDSIGTCHLLTVQKQTKEVSLREGSYSSCSLHSTSSSSSSPSTTMFSCSSAVVSNSPYLRPIEPPPRKKKAKAAAAALVSLSSDDTSPQNAKHFGPSQLPNDFTCESLCSYLTEERKRVMVIPSNISSFSFQSTVWLIS